MSFTNYKYGTGLSNVGSYMVSGKPYASSSLVPASGTANPTGNSAVFHKFDFPAVTKEIVISCSGSHAGGPNNVRLAFSERGLIDHVKKYFLLEEDSGGPLTLNVKATELYVMSDNGGVPRVSVYASLTGIPTDRITNISPSGSNWSGSSGVG